MNTTYYQILGISRTAGSLEIKQAFKRLALLYHPDRNGGSVTHELQFKKINEAYQVLSNPQRKQAYDLKLYYSTAKPTGPGPASPYQTGRVYRPQPAPAAPQAQAAQRPRTAAKPQAKKQEAFSTSQVLLAVFILVCIVGFAVVLKFTMDHITAVDDYETAQTYINEKRYGEAYELLLEAIDFKPNYGEAYLSKAELEANIYKNTSASIESYSLAFAKLEKVTAAHYYQRAQSYIKEGDYQHAETDLTQALQLNPTLKMAYLERAYLRVNYLGSVQSALIDLNLFFDQNKDTTGTQSAYFQRATAYYLLGEQQKSKADIQKIISIKPNNANAYELLRKVYLAQQDTTAACQNLAIAARLGSSSANNLKVSLCKP